METVYIRQTTEEKLADFLGNNRQAVIIANNYSHSRALPDYAGDLYICKELVKILVDILEDKL